MDELSEDDKLVVARARKGFSVPPSLFFVAEVFTGSPESMSPEGYHRRFQGDRQRRVRSSSGAGFYMIGGIEEAAGK